MNVIHLTDPVESKVPPPTLSLTSLHSSNSSIFCTSRRLIIAHASTPVGSLSGIVSFCTISTMTFATLFASAYLSSSVGSLTNLKSWLIGSSGLLYAGCKVLTLLLLLETKFVLVPPGSTMRKRMFQVGSTSWEIVSVKASSANLLWRLANPTADR